MKLLVWCEINDFRLQFVKIRYTVPHTQLTSTVGTQEVMLIAQYSLLSLFDCAGCGMYYGMLPHYPAFAIYVCLSWQIEIGNRLADRAFHLILYILIHVWVKIVLYNGIEF